MRLYNPTSCTPILPQANTPRSPPKTFLPRDATNNGGSVARSIDFALDSPRAKCRGHADVAQEQQVQCSSPARQVGLFPSKQIAADTKMACILQEEDVHMDEDDGISITSSSTLSTHTTLQQKGLPTASSLSSRGQQAYGICAPFPTSAYRSTRTTQKFLSPLRSGRIITVENQQKAPYLEEKRHRSPQPEDCAMTTDDDASGSFKVLRSQGRSPRSQGRSPRSCGRSPRSQGRSPRSQGRSGLGANARFTSHAGFLTRMQDQLQLDDTPRDRPFCSMTKDETFRNGGNNAQEEHPCPQLSFSTDCSDDSSWFDFSRETSENPFHNKAEGNAPRFKSAAVFVPIEKAPVSRRRRPLMTIKPRPTNGSNFPSTSSSSSGTKNNDGTKSVRSAPCTKSPVRFPVQSVKHHREKQRNNTLVLSRHVLKGPRSDSEPIHNIGPSGLFRPAPGGRNGGNVSPDYSKYSAMFRSGVSRDCVRREMEEDGIERSIIDLVLLAATKR